ncbi:MAG TPA: 4-(cytidine 5'-diphospho)-2-C-methyl-D-erythritol kinase [Planctomycetota bacterium]|nr:4-(cytidine 5'-diphospho)-2-C-methyl-D-erythritol kinase [Planctomycetota bacterium]
MSAGESSAGTGAWVRALAPAKVNPWLEVLARRADGYHEVELTLLCLDLADRVEVRRRSRPGIGIEVRGAHATPDIPVDGTNLAARAAAAVLDAARAAGAVPTGTGLDLRLEKEIPSGAGLGGGSSDAAAAALAAQAALGFQPGPAELAARLGNLGSDCNFFLAAAVSGYGRATGRGEVVEPLPRVASEWSVALVTPGTAASTAAVYSSVNLASRGAPRAPELRHDVLDLPQGAARAALFNRLEEPALSQYPELRAWRETLDRAGAAHFRLSGSGSSFFGLFRDPREARRSLERLLRAVRERSLAVRGAWLTRPAGHGAKLAG